MFWFQLQLAPLQHGHVDVVNALISKVGRCRLTGFKTRVESAYGFSA